MVRQEEGVMRTIVVCICVLVTTMAAADVGRNEGQRPTHAGSYGGGALALVGFSGTTTQGDVGLFTLHRMCKKDFGEMARACTMKEVQRSIRIPVLPEELAWVNSETYESVGTGEFSDCAGWNGSTWRGDGGIGTVVDSQGRFDRSSCFELHPVACCSSRQERH